MNNFKPSFFLFLKGMAMGIADLLPGISGGTIAIITGIYQKLITSISAINKQTLKKLLTLKIKDVYKQFNGNFLLILLSGIFTSVLIFSSLLEYLLKEQAILLWSFFLGLMMSATWILLAKEKITKNNIIKVLLLLILGTSIAFLLTHLPPIQNSDTSSYFSLFLAGFIAISALLLPGISGSFLLLIMGKYHLIIQLINQAKILDLAALKSLSIFMIGIVLGLLSFSKIINFLLKKYWETIIFILIGFIVGALPKLWPWQKIVSEKLYQSISPFTYEKIYGAGSAQIILAIAFILLGFGIPFVIKKIEKLTKK